MPDPGFDAAAYWRRHSHSLVGGLLQRVEELSVSDFPADTPNDVIQFLRDFLAELGQLIDKTASQDKLRSFCGLVQQLSQSLDWLDNAHTGQTPRGLVLVLKHLIDQLQPGARVVARPQAEYNYSIGDLGNYFQSLVKQYIPHSRQPIFDSQLAAPLKLISFPRIERDNLLAHAIFGHELGHPIASEFLAHEQGEADYKRRQSDVQREVASLIANRGITDEEDKLQQQAFILERVLQVRTRALEELVSDTVGMLVFGAPAFFSMYELLWSGNWDSIPSSPAWYPPSRMRVRLMIGIGDELKLFTDLWSQCSTDAQAYVDATRAFVDDARQLVAATPDRDAIAGDPVLKLAYDWAESALRQALEFSKLRVAKLGFDHAPSYKHLPELIRRLELGIPPNEVGDPGAPTVVDYRASLLAAWMYKLRGLGSAGAPLTAREAGELEMRTLRAVEYVVLQNEYASHMDGQA
jgi:hypothetical protein